MKKNAKDKSSFLVYGMISLTIAILLRRYLSSLPYVDFIEGLLYGISIASSLIYWIKIRQKNT